MTEDNARSDKRLTSKMGQGDKSSRQQAEAAAKRNLEQVEMGVVESVPLNANGKPLVKISMAASELIPTGQFANVAVGPVQITAWIDPDEPEAFGPNQLANIAKAANELAEVAEVEVVAVQRNLVLESIQEQ